jgi:hypothetical protein
MQSSLASSFLRQCENLPMNMSTSFLVFAIGQYLRLCCLRKYRPEVLVIRPRHRCDVLVTCTGKLEYLMRIGLLDLSYLHTLILGELANPAKSSRMVVRSSNCKIVSSLENQVPKFSRYMVNIFVEFSSSQALLHGAVRTRNCSCDAMHPRGLAT